MKKIILFLAIVLIVFGGIAGITKYKQSQQAKNNPYAPAKSVSKLSAETRDQLDDPLYQNIILPKELNHDLKSGKDVTVYYFMPTCPHCKRTTPVVSPLAKDMGIDLKEFNLTEFESGWDDYKIKATPTIVHYKNGKEAARLVGEHTKQEFRQWFKAHVKK
ncbi:MAG: thioredoxin family protein [Heyndrickxia faecalis]|jgi:thiol-disulfide isomerase/thioredoxin|uniref:thioredoxin family protein n=1 Tax=Heyndrickxia TaxID=2837504 RepID=UPI00054ED5B6|nr:MULTISPECIES: thioredoxin family protein [Heyndrickxia]APB36991.1 thiol reductase thioredoxin [Heyndrickxia coagulans]AWP37948.1 thioredoxin family protein [Heyndrickxia coagulans]KGT38566.1 thioredoxin [Heyndrickxia coagulans P38]MEC2224935.1 thioredoxin family protein [Weizmannia sp. CD-2023]MED4322055.1 thioredoxin family protein [Weizmannia sp. CD-2023]